jgi:hypothetical protein
MASGGGNFCLVAAPSVWLQKSDGDELPDPQSAGRAVSSETRQKTTAGDQTVAEIVSYLSS